MADAGFLAALQLGDSLFPSGGFTLSHGLETLAERGLIADAAGLQEWIACSLRWQVGPSDGVAASAAWAAADDLEIVAEIDRLLHATKLTREPREASERTGRQLLRTLAALVPAAGGALSDYRRLVLAGRAPGLQPVVLGLAGWRLGIGQRETVLLLLHLYVAGCLGAALRLLDVDDVETQRIRLALQPALVVAADEALALPWKEMYACAVHTELMTMIHERATMRLFAS